MLTPQYPLFSDESHWKSIRQQTTLVSTREQVYEFFDILSKLRLQLGMILAKVNSARTSTPRWYITWNKLTTFAHLDLGVARDEVIVESTPKCGVERMSYLLDDGSNYKLI
jgi:hypothetical protein